MTDTCDGDDRWTAYEVDDGDYVVCERGNADAWIRSDTVVELTDCAVGPEDGTRAWEP